MIFYDFEVFKKDWLVVFIDMTKKEKVIIVNDEAKLKAYYETNVHDIWCGFNNRHYDQYIMKGTSVSLISLPKNPSSVFKPTGGFGITS